MIGKSKTYTQLFELIDEFTRPKTGKLIKPRSLLDNLEASIKQSGKNFYVTFDWNRGIKEGKQLGIGKDYAKVEFQAKNQSYILSDLFLGTHSPPQFTAQTSFLYTKGYSLKKKFYYRILIPLEEVIRYHYTLKARSGTIHEDTLFFSIIQNDKKEYFLAIESDLKQSYDEFSEKTFALKNALGYLTGYLAGNGGYFFAYTKKKMETPSHIYRCEFRNSIISNYTPLNSNPYSYLHDNQNLAKKYYDKKLLRTVNQDEFSLLCQRLYDSVELSSAIILMLESSVASLLFMPGGYAIVLETLADIIKPKKKVKVAPMTKSVSKKVREECAAVIEKYKDEFSKDNYKALLDRISWLNQATNKAKLRAPFDYLEIDLLEEDLDILQARNDFLHGRVPDMTKAGKDRSLDRQNKDLYYASVRFYTLLNILILKWIGYDNRVINYPKINEDYTGIKLREEPYRRV